MGDKALLLEPQNMIRLYARGAFPMADPSGEINWYMPEIRSIIPLDDYNYPRSLRKFLENEPFTYSFDKRTMEVIENCAARSETWISKELINAYEGLIKYGHLHSIEVYEENRLVGGLYGVTFRGAFFGESMFSKISQASKAALVQLIEHLNEKGFLLLDIQFVTEHLKMFGAREIGWSSFQSLLEDSYEKDVQF